MAKLVRTFFLQISIHDGEHDMLNKRLLTALLFIFVSAFLVAPAIAQDDLMGDFTVSHYFGGFGGEYIEEIVDEFVAANPHSTVKPARSITSSSRNRSWCSWLATTRLIHSATGPVD